MALFAKLIGSAWLHFFRKPKCMPIGSLFIGREKEDSSNMLCPRALLIVWTSIAISVVVFGGESVVKMEGDFGFILRLQCKRRLCKKTPQILKSGNNESLGKHG